MPRRFGPGQKKPLHVRNRRADKDDGVQQLVSGDAERFGPVLDLRIFLGPDEVAVRVPHGMLPDFDHLFCPRRLLPYKTGVTAGSFQRYESTGGGTNRHGCAQALVKTKRPRRVNAGAACEGLFLRTPV